MNEQHSVSGWIVDARHGDDEAISQLWQRYFQRLAKLAAAKLSPGSKRVTDEEDIALSVMQSFCAAAEAGKFENLSDRAGLWRLLVRMTSRKVVDHRRHQGRQKRGGDVSVRSDQDRLADVIGDAPSPEFALMVREQCEQLIQALESEVLRKVAVAKLSGDSNAVIARRLNCSERTVERRLRLIREICLQQDSTSDDES